jgi:serine/threonine-protein kinase
VTDPLLDRLLVAVGNQYLVDTEIGRGGMAVVYSATDLRLHRKVAIKVLPPELAFNADISERFMREAQTAANLTHSNIVPIYTVDEREGIVYFVMALVEGESLAQKLAREPRLSVDEARKVLSQVADALGFAHSKGVVHRDVKPDNIMLDRATGRPMVTDFGIARAAQGDTRLTVTGIAIGTPAYMSPEQALGERELDGRSDIYSLGVIGYQMLAGETPFKASNTPAMLVKHVSETPRPLAMLRPDTPASLAHAIGRALAKKPEERWLDASAFRDAILDTTSRAPTRDVWSAPQVPPPANSYRAPLAPPLGSPPSTVDPSYLDTSRYGESWTPALTPPMPPAPIWGDQHDWKEWRRNRKRWERENRRYRLAMGVSREEQKYSGLTVDERTAHFRRHAIGSLLTVATLGAVNVFTSPHFFWFLFPGVFITLGVVKQAGTLWADGIPFSKLFSRGAPDRSLARLPQPSAASLSDAAHRLAGTDVINGPYGDAVRRAAADWVAIKDTIARLPEAESKMIPDVAPTVDALAERVGALATTLHRLDGDVGSSSARLLDARLAALRAESRGSPSAEQERRIALLERQRTSITELSERKSTLASQLESAALALQNLRLDLLKLRSSGLESAMSDVSSATQEARALSREIGNVVDAVREVRRL